MFKFCTGLNSWICRSHYYSCQLLPAVFIPSVLHYTLGEAYLSGSDGIIVLCVHTYTDVLKNKGKLYLKSLLIAVVLPTTIMSGGLVSQDSVLLVSTKVFTEIEPIGTQYCL